MKTDVSTKIVKKGIKEDRKTQTLSPRNYSGYGIWTEKGWEFE